MKYYIYFDVYFGFNFFMDFLMLLILRRWNHCRRSRWFCLLGGLVGAVYAGITITHSIPAIVRWALTYCCMGPVLSLIAFDFRGFKALGAFVMQLYVVAFFLSGILVVGGSMTGTEQSLYSVTGLLRVPDMKFCIGMAFFAYLIFSALLQRMQRHMKMQRRIVPVKVTAGGKTVSLRGLCDTGNFLVEPITGKPACVMEKSAAKKLFKVSAKPVVLPYSSIDCAHGILEGFWADRLTVGRRVYEKIPVGIREKVSQSHQYEIILPPEIFEGKGNIDGEGFRQQKRDDFRKEGNVSENT